MVGILLLDLSNILGVVVMVLSPVLFVAMTIHATIQGRKYAALTYNSRQEWWNTSFGVDFTPSQVRALQYQEDITIENPKTQEVEVYSLVKDENMQVVAVKIHRPNSAENLVTA